MEILPKNESLFFSVDAAIKDVIGRDLITDDFVAVFELVKNSFDASATEVTLYFDSENDQINRIFIIDDGKGMSYTDITEKWLRLAYSAKKDGTEDGDKRTYSGFKGIGRFSCDRLGSKLKIQSKTVSDTFVHNIKAHWLDFENKDKEDFIKVPIEYSRSMNFTNPTPLIGTSSGVIIEISELRDAKSWNRAKLLQLKRSLEKLIDPISSEHKINLICPLELDTDKKESNNAKDKGTIPNVVNSEVKNTVFNILANKTTILNGRISQDGYLYVELLDRGTFIYQTREKIVEEYSELVDSEFEFKFSYLNQSAKNMFYRTMNVRVIDFGSLFLLRNGFRVYPVGEKSNDYWGLDYRKQQGYSRFLGSRDLLGYVKISGPEEKYKEASSRDQGLIKTQAVEELKNCVMRCMKKFEAYVVDVTWVDKLDKEYDNFERMSLDGNRVRIFDLIEKLALSKGVEVLDYNRNLISILNQKSRQFAPSLKKLRNIADSLNDDNLSNQVNSAEKELLKAKAAEQRALEFAEKERQARVEAERIASEEKKKAEKSRKEKDSYKSAFKEEAKRNLFLTSSTARDKDLLEAFMHQIILYAADTRELLGEHLSDRELIESLKMDEVYDLLSMLFELNEKVLTTSRFATTANFRLESSLITEDMPSFIEDYLNTISRVYNASKIRIDVISTEKEFEHTFNPIEFGMVLENFISNSRKAKAVSITFQITILKNVLVIDVFDDGKGLPKSLDDKDRIFEKGFTRTDGSGIGLSFAKSKIEQYGGEIFVAETQPKRGTHLKIRIAK